jgi:hypothetical protein
VNTADALSFLGHAHVGKGEAAAALPPLTRAVEAWRRFRHRPMLGWFTGVLAEACLLDGQLDRAREVAVEAVALTRGVGFRYGIGVAERARGRVARAAGRLVEADDALARALETFAAIEARAEAAATRLDRAAVAQGRGDAGAAAHELAEAVVAFRALALPRREAEAARLAARLGVPLAPPSGSAA